MAHSELSASTDAALQILEDRRIGATKGMDRRHRATFGQFFTPGPIAAFMASLLEFPKVRGKAADAVYLLDPGAGIGSLTAAVAARTERPMSATCYELEAGFQGPLQETLASLPSVTPKIETRDFIAHAVLLSASGKTPGYSHVIMNPPYKKISTGSNHRELVRKLGVESSNLYTCFVAAAVVLCRPGAQIVAIIPRSFMNGPYFKSFRYWLLGRVALTHIHVFDRRDQTFSDDDVLQENVVVRMVVGAEQGDVVVTSSSDPHLADIRKRVCSFEEIVTPADEELFIHVPTVGSPSSAGLPGVTLRELGLDVCTGPVVDFRLRDHLRAQPERGTVPLLYASHFAGGSFTWPRDGRKPNAIARNGETEKWLMPNSCYVVLRRFSSKEEKRRVVAFLLDGKELLPGDAIGFENHLNVIHRERAGLSSALARGLVAYLNSKEVDEYFRVFSGHTQVNATDLRRLRYPSIRELEKLGRAARAQKGQRGAANTQ